MQTQPIELSGERAEEISDLLAHVINADIDVVCARDAALRPGQSALDLEENVNALEIAILAVVVRVAPLVSLAVKDGIERTCSPDFTSTETAAPYLAAIFDAAGISDRFIFNAPKVS